MTAIQSFFRSTKAVLPPARRRVSFEHATGVRVAALVAATVTMTMLAAPLAAASPGQLGSTLPSDARTATVPKTPQAPPDGYRWTSFPASIEYRTLSNAPGVGCALSDPAFSAAMVALNLDKYQGVMVDGTRGTCDRANAEQYKRLYPDKVVINRSFLQNPLPLDLPGTWPGYYAFMNGTITTIVPQPTDTSLAVVSTSALNAGDVALLSVLKGADPYGTAEYVQVISINSPTTVTVRRAAFGTPSASFTSRPKLTAIYTNAALIPSAPMLNFSAMAPVNPANGKQAIDWLADFYRNDFVPSAGAPSLDGYEFDTNTFAAQPYNQNGAVKNLDCNADGVIDYCEQNVGTSSQTSSWGVGYQQLIDDVHTIVAAFDAPGTTTPKLVLTDKRVYNNTSATGAELESFPNDDNYDQTSSALSMLDASARASSQGLSFAYTKDISPTYPTVSATNPTGCVVAPAGTCRNANYRFGIVASTLMGTASAYNDEAWMDHVLALDEQATINTATTGLTPGYLGAPVGPLVRQTRYTSANLVGNANVETNTAGWLLPRTAGTAATLTWDTTTAAVSTHSLRGDVTGVLPEPGFNDVTLKYVLTANVAANSEYTVSFWAKAAPASGGTSRTVKVLLDGLAGYGQAMTLSPQWQQYFVNISTSPSGFTTPSVKLQIGADTGTYWFDDVQVHQGTAGIITREFANGITVLNESGSPQANIPLPNGPYHHFNGVQDHAVNDGQSIGSTLDMAYKDGAILLRGGTPDPHALTGMQLAMASTTVPGGASVVATATGTYADGTIADLTSQVTYGTSDSTVATVDPGGTVTAVGLGSAIISASLAEVSGNLVVTATAPVIAALNVTPAAATLAKGTTLPLQAIATLTDGTVYDATAEAVWSTSNSMVVSVDATGLATANSVGSAMVTAADGAIIVGADLTVSPATLLSIQVTPANPSLPKGTSQQMTATGTYTDGNRDLTALARWTSAGTTKVTITSGGGLAYAVAQGGSKVTATLGGTTGTTKVTVVAAALVSIQITPSAANLAKGTTLALLPRGTYSDGSIRVITTTTTWASTNSSIATVSSAGLITGKGVGAATVTGTSSGIVGSTAITVTPAILTSIKVTPAAPNVARGSTLWLTATGTYSDGSTVNLTSSVTWTSLLPNKVTVTAGGLVTGVNIGTTNVKATLSGRSSGVLVTVY